MLHLVACTTIVFVFYTLLNTTKKIDFIGDLGGTTLVTNLEDYFREKFSVISRQQDTNLRHHLEAHTDIQNYGASLVI